MAVHLSKPPETPVRVKRTEPVLGLRWRSAEERREARRKIDAIRRDAERQRLEALRIDAKAFHSPKVLLAILMGMSVVAVALMLLMGRPQPEKPDITPLNQRRARKSVATIALAMTLHRVHTGAWPQQRLGLFALAKDYGTPGWKGPYINWAYKDPWGTHYVYRMPQSPFEAPTLFSCGPDKLPDTNDDIRALPEDFACKEGDWRRTEAPAEPAPIAPTPISPETRTTP